MNSTKQKYRLNQIYFYLTGACNLCCRHCWIISEDRDSRSNIMLSLDTIRSIIEQAKPLGLTGVKLTGGEPFLNPEMDSILKYIQNEDLRLTIETNGVLCTREIASQIARCSDAFISVSLDGADAATHEWVRGKSGCFDASIQGIRYLVEAGLKPQIIMSLLKCNYHQMEAVVRLSEKIGAGSVKFNITMPISKGKHLHHQQQTLSIHELVKTGAWVENDLTQTSDLPIYFDQPPAFRSLGNLFSKDRNGFQRCGILNILGVLPDGSYALCGIGTNEPDMVFGDSRTISLKDVWIQNSILNELRNGLPDKLEGICKLCLMKYMCLGSCIAQIYSQHKCLWGSFWYCNEAYRAGIFPKTRMIPLIEEKMNHLKK